MLLDEKPHALPIHKGLSWVNWALGYHRNPVHEGCPPLYRAVPVDGGALMQDLVCHRDLYHLVLVEYQCGSWDLFIDRVDKLMQAIHEVDLVHI